jgi:hypothetical protein
MSHTTSRADKTNRSPNFENPEIAAPIRSPQRAKGRAQTWNAKYIARGRPEGFERHASRNCICSKAMREWVTPQPGHGTPRKWRSKQKCGILTRTGANKQASKTERKTLRCTRFCSPIGSRFDNHLGQTSISIMKLHHRIPHSRGQLDWNGCKNL